MPLRELNMTQNIKKYNKKLFLQIDKFLTRYSQEHSVLDLSELDGFCCAIACSPQIIPVTHWMPQIWGGEEFTPEWQSEEEINSYVNCIMTYFGQVIDALIHNNYSPHFSEDVLDKTQDTRVDEWCFGFMRGYQLWPKLDKTQQNYLDEPLKLIKIFVSEEGFQQESSTQGIKTTDIEKQIKKYAQEIFNNLVDKSIYTD